MTYETYCKYRDKKGLTNNKVAREVKIDSQLISSWKCEKSIPTFAKQKLLADFLQVPSDEFAERKNA